MAGAHGVPPLGRGSKAAAQYRQRRLPADVPRPRHRGLHALRDSLGFIVKARLPIGKDGRNRPSLFPFGTATGRNAHTKSPYNAHAGMRSFMVFPPTRSAVYLDWRTQEVGVAAALSGDQALMADYAAGDIYHALARLCGLTDDPDPIRWKKQNRPMRDRMKPLQLAINYGMGVPSLARGLDRHPLIASEIIERHKRRYPSVLAMARRHGADRHVASGGSRAISAGRCISGHSPNKRTSPSPGCTMISAATRLLGEIVSMARGEIVSMAIWWPRYLRAL